MDKNTPLNHGFPFRVLGALGAAVIIALSACHSGEPVPAAESPVAPHVREGELIVVPEKSELRHYLAIAEVQQQTVQTPLEAPAVLEADPAKVANILPPLSGRISALYVHLGDAVIAGQPLFTLDSADLAQARSDLQHAQIGLTQTQKALSRQQDLADHHIAAQKDLEQAQADHDNAVTEFERASTVFRVLGISAQSAESPRQLTMRAPLSGRVSTLNAVPGTYANDNTAALMTISDASTIWFTAGVQEKDLSYVRVGEEVSATVQAFAGETFQGKVSFVADQLDPDTRTIKARIAYDNHDGRLKPGMFSKLTFAGTPHAAVLVPVTALIQNEARTLVFVEVQPWKFEPRPVLVGARNGDSVEILGGLKAGERAVVKQGVLLND
ncbi:MAG: efflux RND transporter periplasmic adaptor subunit [Nevskiales bacterium]